MIIIHNDCLNYKLTYKDKSSKGHNKTNE